MASYIPAVRGSVKIEVLKEGKVVKTTETPNTLVLEAPKLMLGNIIGPDLITSNSVSFPQSDPTRPTITPDQFTGPTAKFSVNYLSLGYSLTNTVDSVTVSASDTLPLGASNTVTKLLTGVSLGEYSVQFICEFQVDESTASRNYFEAALLCPALLEFGTTFMPDPEDPGSGYDPSVQVMFAHQTHTPLQASAGSTIRYTWTITMQEPSDG